MRYAAIVLAGLALASCDYVPQQAVSVPPDRQVAFIALVEQSGCVVDPIDHDFVHAGGFSDPEIVEIGGLLVADGRGEYSGEGDLVLLTGACI